jgi:hypothetical protein
MSRRLRFVPEGGALVEVTCRTVQGRHLLRPSPQLNKIVLSSHYHLSADAWKNRALNVVDQIETETAARRARTGSQPLGVAAILGKHPHHRPARLKKSPAPLFHAFRQSVRQGLYEGYAWFVAAFRQAAEKLKAGDRSAAFPAGCFPPALPFVGG